MTPSRCLTLAMVLACACEPEAEPQATPSVSAVPRPETAPAEPTPEPPIAPAPEISAPTHATIAVSDSHACAIVRRDGDQTDRLHNCTLSKTGAVACWGHNRSGELGQGHTRSPGRKPGQFRGAAPAPTPVDLGSAGRATAVTAGNAYSCALIERSPTDLGLKCALPYVDLGKAVHVVLPG